MTQDEWLKEAESLIDEYGRARWDTGCADTSFDKLGSRRYDAEAQEARAALISHLAARPLAVSLSDERILELWHAADKAEAGDGCEIVLHFAHALLSAASAVPEVTEQPQSVARIAEIEENYPWRIGLVWHISVPDLAKFGIVKDALLYAAPIATPAPSAVKEPT